MIFLQELTAHMIYPSCGRREAMIFLQNLSDRMLPFLWQTGSQNSFAKTGNSHATLTVVDGKPWYFCKTSQTACYTLPVAGGEPWFFCKNLRDCLLPFLSQVGSHDIFAKTWQPACYPSCGRREAKIFLQIPASRMLPFLWQVGSQDIFANTGILHASLHVAGGKPRYLFLLQM